MNKYLLFSLAVATLMVSPVSYSAVVTYTDRVQFENALDSFAVDSFDGITSGSSDYTVSVIRSDFTMTYTSPGGGGFYGCVNHVGCGDNSVLGFDNAYLWDYSAEDTFTFNSAINAFGFDFSGPVEQPSVSPILQGITAPSTMGFFGIVSDDLFNIVTLGQTSQFMIIDDITYGTTNGTPSAVPVPAAVWLFGSALIGLVGFSKRRKIT